MPLAAVAGAVLVRLLGSSWRIDRAGLDRWRGDEGEGCIFAFWHARLLPLVYTHRGRGIAVLVSRHHAGELIARILGSLGNVTARGSSTRGAEEGVLEMLRHAEGGRCLAVTPDGPRGPARVVKPGLVYLASRTGLPVVPLAASALASHRFRSWDGFCVPHLFARVVVAEGDAVRVPAGLDAGGTEEWRLRLEESIERLTRETDRRAGVDA